ncbi:hypothetical protein THIOM_000258 [Candidatus Thiomargarita nelsonii]|uniref:Uncharacterized protein n=1 Tax=Candidatus Thiomargarita nelsonii TaxID=1003181 RepID=A0A176S7L9_9GAMM|nr:hypothetical protein THIOM_000258 [Candidatus Thiomargarita nelsonii]
MCLQRITSPSFRRRKNLAVMIINQAGKMFNTIIILCQFLPKITLTRRSGFCLSKLCRGPSLGL